jgi:hypothetical protein
MRRRGVEPQFGPVSANGVCFNKDIGVASAGAFANFGHLGSRSDAASINNDSLFIDNSGSANFEDVIVFSDPTAPFGATTQVSVNMLLDGAFNAATDGHGRAGAFVGGFVAFGGGGFDFRFSTDGPATSTAPSRSARSPRTAEC